jgi:hypothetical protein
MTCCTSVVIIGTSSYKNKKEKQPVEVFILRTTVRMNDRGFCCINSQHTRPTECTVLTSVKYVSCFQDATYQDPIHLHNHSTKKWQHFNYLTTLHHMNCIKNVANLVLFGIAFIWFLDDDPLWIETCRVIHCALTI